jgi:DNA polymerase
MQDRDAAVALLRWYIEMGADEAIAAAPQNRFLAGEDAPRDRSLSPDQVRGGLSGRAEAVPGSSPGQALGPREARTRGREPEGSSDKVARDRAPIAAFAPPPPATPAAAAPPPSLLDSPAEAAQSARLLAAEADTVEALAAAVARFEGCALKRTATNTVFIDGNPRAPVIIIGEGPGAEEDRTGRPFVGRAGQLLDRMLAAIGLDRQQVLITNVVYWRPPGNRTPTAAEIAACLPFVLRLIALVAPKVLVLCGGTAAGALLPQAQGITRLRGRWFNLQIPGVVRPVPTLPMYHPAFLLRTPERKREAWRDLLSLRERLDELSVGSEPPPER